MHCNVKLFFTLVVRTGGNMAEGSGFDSDSGSWKYRYFSMVTHTFIHISSTKTGNETRMDTLVKLASGFDQEKNI